MALPRHLRAAPRSPLLSYRGGADGFFQQRVPRRRSAPPSRASSRTSCTSVSSHRSASCTNACARAAQIHSARRRSTGAPRSAVRRTARRSSPRTSTRSATSNRSPAKFWISWRDADDPANLLCPARRIRSRSGFLSGSWRSAVATRPIAESTSSTERKALGQNLRR